MVLMATCLCSLKGVCRGDRHWGMRKRKGPGQPGAQRCLDPPRLRAPGQSPGPACGLVLQRTFRLPGTPHVALSSRCQPPASPLMGSLRLLFLEAEWTVDLSTWLCCNIRSPAMIQASYLVPTGP